MQKRIRSWYVSSPAVDKHVVATGNTKDVNVEQTPTSPTVDPNQKHLGTWGKYGLVKSMLNSATEIFSFQFSSIDGLDAVLENGNLFAIIRLFLKSGIRMSSYARALIEVRADVELKDNIVVAMPKLVGEGSIRDECPKNIDSDVVKNMKKPRQAPKDVLVGSKVGFKPVKQVHRQVSKKNNVNTSGNKKKDVEPTIELSNSNPFDVLNSVENDVDLGTNDGTSNLASKKTNSSGSLFWKVKSTSTSTTPIVAKIDKIERLIIDLKVTLVDDGVSLWQSLPEQWKETYENDDYDIDPYDDDMYEGQDIPDKRQATWIIWISKFEVVRRNSFIVSFVV
ncbi:hypothetical protein Tco_0824612 [Tanacetum coccineum]|uniref:Uncharacterized protein n=1 Tax=Tanacetum coccineum TaxID=301880 RepID=A0ABQ5AM60_9ASTR